MIFKQRTPFEKNYNLLSVFNISKLRFGLYLKLNPRHWFRIFWNHPEADAIWYSIGPFDFYTY